MEEKAKIVEQLVLQGYTAQVDAGARSEAFRYLADFRTSPEAWDISRLLFNSTSADVQFFAAHTLYTKIGLEWNQLGAEQKHALRSLLVQLLQHFSQGTVVVRSRLALALAAMGLRGYSDGFWPSVMDDVISLQSLGAQIVLDVLTYLPEELDAAVLPDAKKLQTREGLKLAAPKAFAVIQSNLTQAPALPLALQALRCALSWLTHLRIPPSALGSQFCGLVFSHLANSPLFDTALKVIHEILTHGEVAATPLVPIRAVLELRKLYNDALKDGNEDICEGVSKLVAQIGSEHAHTITKNDHEEYMTLVAFILECTKHPEPQVASHTFFFWCELGFLLSMQPEGPQQQPFVQAYAIVTQVLIGLCRYPADYDPSKDDGDSLPELQELRTSSERAFESCWRLLKSQYYGFVYEMLKSPSSNQWQTVEAVLFALQATAWLMTHLLPCTADMSQALRNIFVYLLQFLQRPDLPKRAICTVLTVFGTKQQPGLNYSFY
eukprot:TRINITY_DN6970_c0_g1_i1.p1 TRINITY_DN6970_c0_g1~~TRINITY_DN6970_c0_g1_i1.p1  ORF type:complete len:493 (+),score=49.93 TRINITY_DN6970_c0_g1_i1:312-1790(+)